MSTASGGKIKDAKNEYFKEGADHGKEIVFRSLGYEKQHSEILSQLYLRQGTEKYIKGCKRTNERTVLTA